MNSPIIVFELQMRKMRRELETRAEKGRCIFNIITMYAPCFGLTVTQIYKPYPSQNLLVGPMEARQNVGDANFS
jgi:hypothetical protein